MRADFRRYVIEEFKDISYYAVDKNKWVPVLIYAGILRCFLVVSHFWASPQAVEDLLVMRELLCSEPRSLTLSFMHDCFSSINISVVTHQEHRQD